MRIQFEPGTDHRHNAVAILLDLRDATYAAGFGLITEAETGSAQEPALRIHLLAPPPPGTIIDVPIQLSVRPYPSHAGLNAKIGLHGARNAFDDFVLQRSASCIDGHGSELAVRVRLP